MGKLELFYPVKPLSVNQAFGIYNPAYQQFGFNKHNGIDYGAVEGEIARAMCDGLVTDVGENKSAGKYAKYQTEGPVDAEGRVGVVEFMYMHGESILVKRGQMVKAGDALIVCDNTGFSTGRHLHISAYFVGVDGKKLQVLDAKSDHCFDFAKYYNRFYAVDAPKVFGLYYQIIALLRKMLKP